MRLNNHGLHRSVHLMTLSPGASPGRLCQLRMSRGIQQVCAKAGLSSLHDPVSSARFVCCGTCWLLLVPSHVGRALPRCLRGPRLTVPPSCVHLCLGVIRSFVTARGGGVWGLGTVATGVGRPSPPRHSLRLGLGAFPDTRMLAGPVESVSGLCPVPTPLV